MIQGVPQENFLCALGVLGLGGVSVRLMHVAISFGFGKIGTSWLLNIVMEILVNPTDDGFMIKIIGQQ